MSCLMLLLVVLLVFALTGSLVVLWKKIQKPELIMAIKASPDAGLAGCWAVLFFCALFWLWLAVQQQESTLTIHPVSQALACLTVFPSGIISTQTVSVLKVSPAKRRPVNQI